MKGIILAGGAGTRLYPSTLVNTKQLLTVYDKPMIYYPLTTLMLSGIRDILVISTPDDTPKFETLLGHGKELGITLSYLVQDKPRGIAHAFIVAENHINSDKVCLILGDNIFYGQGLPHILRKAAELENGAVIFGYRVNDPKRYGVVTFDRSGKVLELEEKPEKPKSNYAIPGLYFYDQTVVDVTKSIKPSGRGELEITDVNKEYLRQGSLSVELIGRGSAWLDTGTPESLLDAANYIATIEKRQGLKIACIEEVAYRMGFINKEQLENVIEQKPNCDYKDYLIEILYSENHTLHV